MITPAYSPTATERVLPRMALDFTTGALDSRVTFTRGSTGTFIGSNGLIQTAAINAPRFGYDPVTLVRRGLLVEEQRTNLLTYSEQFENVAWGKAQGSITANAITAPDGTLTADKFVEDTATNVHYIFRYVTTTAAAHTCSCYIKAAERTFATLYHVESNAGVSINLLTGATGTPSGVVAPTSVTVTDMGNGWYRLAMTSTATAASNQFRIFSATSLTGNGSYTGNGTSGIYVWGAQLEAGSRATSYIPATTASVTRNADVVTMTGTNFSDWYNAGAGSWFIQTNARSGDTLLTAGGFTLAADATALKKYANSYSTDQSASSLVLGSGTIAKVAYYKQALLAAELQALRV